MAVAIEHWNTPGLVEEVLENPDSSRITPKLRALLSLAAKVQASGRSVSAEDIARARENGADDEAIHTTVLIAAAFSMFNRYVDGLDAPTPSDPALYTMMGKRLASQGYV